MEYHIAKGVFDILPKEPDPQAPWREIHRWLYVEEIARTLAYQYGFQEIRTPLFENTHLFERSIGESTDIVTKEMYTFLDKGGRSLTLRPEGTAPVMRAFVEKHLHEQTKTTKFFYLLPMFRYERQQAGRYRQHHQFGIEAIGNSSPLQDAEGIDLLYSFLTKLGLRNLTLHLNSIGSEESRVQFKRALKEYLLPYLGELSVESKTRFETNPLRILDSKDLKDQEILKSAPSILNFLDPESENHFKKITDIFDLLKVPYRINPFLVRGLDYYTKTVFEITAEELGSQNSLGGGGRYDGLTKELGGPDLPAFGFGAGIERIIQTMIGQNAFFPEPHAAEVYFIALGDEAEKKSLLLLHELRKEGVSAEMDMSGKKLKNALGTAHAMKVRFVAIIGEEEMRSQSLTLKEMESGTSEKIPFDQLKQRLKNGKL